MTRYGLSYKMILIGEQMFVLVKEAFWIYVQNTFTHLIIPTKTFIYTIHYTHTIYQQYIIFEWTLEEIWIKKFEEKKRYSVNTTWIWISYVNITILDGMLNLSNLIRLVNQKHNNKYWNSRHSKTTCDLFYAASAVINIIAIF